MRPNSPIDFLTISDIINNYSNFKFVQGKELSFMSMLYGYEITLLISSKNSYNPLFSSVDTVLNQLVCVVNLNSNIGNLTAIANYVEFNRETGNFKFQIFNADINNADINIDISLEAVFLKSNSVYGKIYQSTTNLNERSILCALMSGMKQSDVAAQFNVSQATISNIYRKFKGKGET